MAVAVKRNVVFVRRYALAAAGGVRCSCGMVRERDSDRVDVAVATNAVAPTVEFRGENPVALKTM